MTPATRQQRRTRIRLLVTGAALTLVTAGCAPPAGTEGEAAGESEAAPPAASGDICEGSAALDVISSVEGMSLEEREAELLEQATNTRDGEVDFYTEINDPTTIIDPFEDKYGDLTVNVYRAGSEQIRQRVLEETDASFSGSDLIEMDTLEMAILDDQGILAPAESPLIETLSEAARFENFTGDRLSYIVPGWNSDLVSPEQVPTSLEEYADFEGSLALEGSDVFWFAGLVMLMESEGKSREEAVAVFEDMAANADITSGHTTTTELVVAGQYAIAPNHYVHRLLDLQGQGAPIEFSPVNIPVVAEITATAVHCLSDNPAAALLLQDFVLSEEGGQQIFVDNQRTPANESLAEQTLGGEDIEPVIVDVGDVADNYAEWSELWDGVIRGSN